MVHDTERTADSSRKEVIIVLESLSAFLASVAVTKGIIKAAGLAGKVSGYLKNAKGTLEAVFGFLGGVSDVHGLIRFYVKACLNLQIQ